VALAGACNGNESIGFFHGTDCQGSFGREIGNYISICEGNCFQFDSFESLRIQGNGFLGTDCHAYSYINCQNEMGNSGDIGGAVCLSVPGAKSMKCFYNC
ncbi:hypothetical protein FB451DRAFT_1033133, partial [Mycena latifolia]